MTGVEQPNIDLEAASGAAEDGEALIVDIDGYEGPLHVLLALARSQKVDLLKLSVLKLAEHYLAFVDEPLRLRFSLAADYLVMAAWLAYLKSRLILPKPDKGDGAEPPAEEVAAALALRLARLDAIRKASEAVMGRPQLRRDVFTRGDPDAVKVVSTTRFEGDLYGLVQAYIGQVRKELEIFKRLHDLTLERIENTRALKETNHVRFALSDFYNHVEQCDRLDFMQDVLARLRGHQRN